MAARCTDFHRLIDELVAARTRGEASTIAEQSAAAEVLATLPPRDRERAVEYIADIIRTKPGSCGPEL